MRYLPWLPLLVALALSYLFPEATEAPGILPNGIGLMACFPFAFHGTRAFCHEMMGVDRANTSADRETNPRAA